MKSNAICEIIEALCKHRRLSKSDLSLLTNCSVPTITKYTDFLLDQRIITTSYSNAKKGDIKCKRFDLNHTRYFIIYDFSTPIYNIHVCSLTGKIRKSYTYKFTNDFSFEENRLNFLKSLNFYLSKIGKNMLVGSAVIFADNYDNNLILKSRLNLLADAITFNKNIHRKKAREFYSAFIKECISDNDFALCLFLNYDNFSSCFLSSSSDVSKLHCFDVGESFKIKGIPLKDYIDYCEDITDIIDQLSFLIKTIAATAPITQIFVTGNLFSDMNALKTVMSENLSDAKITINSVDYKDFTAFIVKSLRNSMSIELIDNYLNK